MKPFVLSSRAVNIRVQQYRLVVDDYFNRARHEFPPHELPFDFLVINNSTGSVSLSALKFLIKHGVPVLLLDWNGEPSGTILPPGPINGELQIAQLKAYLYPDKRRFIAGKFLEEKFAKSVQLLAHLKRYYPAVETAAMEQEVKRPVPNRLSDVHGTLMAKEARVAVAYFKELAKVVNQLTPEFKFRARGQSCTSNNMSASDPFNVCLNVAYGVLECWVRSAVNQAGFNESVGFLHEAQRGALPLVYDFMEPFRWLADYSLIQLLEHRALDRSDFLTTTQLRTRMKSDSVGKILNQLRVNFGRLTDGETSRLKYDTILTEDTRKLGRYLGGGQAILSFQARFSVDAIHSDVRERDRLLRLSAQERKLLGLPKTTYFYIRRSAASGRSLRLYSKTRTRIQSHLDAHVS